jgi:hypothetical protein
MDRQKAIELDNALNLFIGKTLYCLKNNIYRIADDESVERFLLEKGFDFDKLPLSNLFDYTFIPSENWKIDTSKLFAMLVDMKISLIEAFNAYYSFTLANNMIIKSGNINKAYLKIEAHNSCVDFILRYRALWDKIMGILVFVYLNSEYDKQWSSSSGKKSRRKKFKTLFENHIIWEKVETYYEALEKFDNEYRTPEAHYQGKARKETIFNTGNYMDISYHKTLLNDYFNPLNDFTNIFGQLLNFAKFQDETYLQKIFV